MALALLFAPAVLVIAVLAWRWRPPRARVVAEAARAEVPAISGIVDPFAALDELLADLEGATVRIDGADELDESAVVELERLAARLEAAAASLERVA
jgi:hypothetical protein